MIKGRITKFIGVGALITILDYAVYEFVALIILQKNVDLLWIATAIAGITSTIVAYFMHNNITWKERNPGKYGVVKFLAWNALVIIVLRSFLAFLFGLFTPLYQLAYAISNGIGLSFSYDFIVSTGVYILITIVTMILNFLVYERLIFGGNGNNRKNQQRGQKKVERVRKTREK